MNDETTAPSLYRTGRRDRSIPFALGLTALVALPLLGWGSGPFLWPWGTLAMGFAAVGAALSFSRWWASRAFVRWNEPEGTLVFQGPGRRVSVQVADLTQVRVCPSAVRTWVVAGSDRFVLSHRLVQVERLLDRLRVRRPDLFPALGDRAVFRVSGGSAAGLALLAMGTGLAGLILAPWQPWVGAAFGAGALVVAIRSLWSVPRSYEVAPGALTVVYGLRRKTWKNPGPVREDAYSSGGAVFFRMRILFGSRRVDLDEGVLLDSLRPQAGWVIRQLGASGHP